MLTVIPRIGGRAYWLLAAAAGIFFSAPPARAQLGPEEGAPSFRQAYIDHVDRQLAGLQSDVNNRRIMLNERGQELLDEIGTRLDEAQEQIPNYTLKPGEAPPPDPPSVSRLNEYDALLGGEVYEIETRILDYLDGISFQRDSLVDDLKTPDAVRPLVDALEKNIRTDLDLWRAKVDFVEKRLIAEGTPDQARRMFARSYNSIVMHYQMGQYQLALDRIEILAKPFGDLPLREWLESLPFYRAECLYALGRWDEAFDGYMSVWQQQTNLYARQALLDWSELAFAGQEYRQLATMWVTRPQLPEDPIDANRVRLLVAESYLRINEPEQALAVLDQLARERPVLKSEQGLLAPEDIAYLQQVNARLLVYGRLLRAEADFMNVKPEKLEITSSVSGTGDSPDFDAMLGIGSNGETAATLDQRDIGKLDSAYAAATGGAKVDTALYYAKKAFLIASGKIRREENREDEAVRKAIKDLEDLLPVVRQLDPDGPLMARALMALGQAYYQGRRWGDAAAAYGAVPLGSVWYPDAQLGRAWAFMEDGDYLDAKTSVNIARRWPLSPSAALEASALNSFILTRLGQDEQAAAEVRNMMVSVTIEERRGASAWMARQLRQIDGSLRLLGVLSLERQNEGLYRAVISEREQLDSLRVRVREVERKLQEYAAGKLDNRQLVTAQIRREQSRLREIQRRVTEMRRQTGRSPSSGENPGLSYEERRNKLQRWLKGVEPADVAVKRQVYENWVEYAEFAYARRLFDENQRRRTRSEKLRNTRARISKLISESP